jgi:hypothetical protein
LQVVGHQHAVAQQRIEAARQRGEELRARGRAGVGGGRGVQCHTQRGQQPRELRAILGRQCLQHRAQRGVGERALQQVSQRMQRHAAADGRAAQVQQRPVIERVFGRQPRLADAGLAFDQRDGRGAGAQRGEFGVTADQGCFESRQVSCAARRDYRRQPLRGANALGQRGSGRQRVEAEFVAQRAAALVVQRQCARSLAGQIQQAHGIGVVRLLQRVEFGQPQMQRGGGLHAAG